MNYIKTIPDRGMDVPIQVRPDGDKDRHRDKPIPASRVGRCNECDNYAIPGQLKCLVHSKHGNTRAAGSKYIRRKGTLCVDCQQPPLPDKARCQKCSDRKNAYARTRHNQRTRQATRMA